MKNYLVKSPVKLPDGIRQEGETVELDEQAAAELIALGAVTAVKDIAPDSGERAAAIQTAIANLDPENTENWLKDGRPTAGPLSAALGFTVSAADRDAAWAAFQETKG